MLPLAEATVIGFSVPIFSTVLAALVLGEPTGRWRWGAVAAGFLGVLLIVQPGTGEVPLLGAAVALVAALLTASVTIVIRRLGATERASTTVFWFAASSLVPLGTMMLWFGRAHVSDDSFDEDGCLKEGPLKDLVTKLAHAFHDWVETILRARELLAHDAARAERAAKRAQPV